MTIKRSIERRMHSLEESGYGCCNVSGLSDVESELYSIALEGVVLVICGGGLSIRQNEKVEFYSYDELLRVVSALDGKLMSKVSRTRDSDFLIPLGLVFESGELTLDVPFLAYSRLLNVVMEMKAEFGSG